MPVYEYACLSCDERAERLLPYEKSQTPDPCDECGGELRRKYSRVGVKLQGWGFSATDGMVADRPGRGDFKAVSERAERISEGHTR